MLKGDSEVVITTLQSTEVSLTTYGHLLESAKSILTTSKCIAFTHICRIGNRVAHNLAKHVRHVRGLSMWVEDIPPQLYEVLFADPGLFFNTIVVFIIKRKKKKKKSQTIYSPIFKFLPKALV